MITLVGNTPVIVPVVPVALVPVADVPVAEVPVALVPVADDPVAEVPVVVPPPPPPPHPIAMTRLLTIARTIQALTRDGLFLSWAIEVS
jgi:hypothetical protein